MAKSAYFKRCMAEGIGTGLLLATVMGSGIMGYAPAIVVAGWFDNERRVSA